MVRDLYGLTGCLCSTVVPRASIPWCRTSGRSRLGSELRFPCFFERWVQLNIDLQMVC